MRRHAPAAVGLNDDAGTLERLLQDFFRPAAAITRKRKAPGSRASSGPRRSAASAVHESVEASPLTPDDHLKRIKQLLRDCAPKHQNAYMKRVLGIVQGQLKSKKAIPQVHTQPSAVATPQVLSDHHFLLQVVKLCTELFARSSAFRALIAEQTSSFYLQLLMASTGDRTLQRVQNASQSTETVQVLTMIETWKEDFGARYPSLVAGHAALEQQGFVFPHVRQVQRQQEQQAQAVCSHQERIWKTKCQQLQREMSKTAPDIEELIVEMNRIFEILVPTLEAFDLADDVVATDQRDSDTELRESAQQLHETTQGHADMFEVEEDDDIEWEDVEEEEEEENSYYAGQMDTTDTVQAYGLGSSSYQLTISIPTGSSICDHSSDNAILFAHLSDGILRLRKRFLPLLQDWCSLVETPASSVDRELKLRVLDLKFRVDAVVLKWEDLAKETERKRLEHVKPSIAPLPLAAYEAPRTSSRNNNNKRKRRRSVHL